ncbi:hypothetical protein MRX96_009480 [Rhipicephalus microplus]
MAVRKRGDARKSEAAASSDCTHGDAVPSAVPLFSTRRIVVRVGVSVALLAALYVSSRWKSESVGTFASRDEVLAIKSETVQCSEDYVSDRRLFKGIVPPQKCGRVVSDSVVTTEEVDALLSPVHAPTPAFGVLRKWQVVLHFVLVTAWLSVGLALSRSDGGASILDLHSGSVSLGKKFVNVYKLLEQKGTTLFSDNDLKVYKQVKDKIRSLIGFQFGVRPDTLAP